VEGESLINSTEEGPQTPISTIEALKISKGEVVNIHPLI
jgi:hypothetical protein